ncbi:MAG: hypothetical protein ACOYBH_06930 [Candidatus Alectryocaccobium sp.]|jgi:hypothetical protein|nr:hypothetical protein [Lachnospiraceae bacterium]MDY6222030.1 hypothetical protein [Candidatus Alectryocaccobium sp.]
MFKKKLDKENKKNLDFDVKYENLAVPEIHIGSKSDEVQDEIDDEEDTEGITYDSVAIPEIHIRRKKK